MAGPSGWAVCHCGWLRSPTRRPLDAWDQGTAALLTPAPCAAPRSAFHPLFCENWSISYTETRLLDIISPGSNEKGGHEMRIIELEREPRLYDELRIVIAARQMTVLRRQCSVAPRR